MSSSLEKLAKYRQVAGIAVAALILTVIFVPFQTASAFTITTTLPDKPANDPVQSAAGENFKVTIDVAAGELISVDSVELILDNGQPTVKRTVFDSSGQRVSGNTDLVRNNALTISIPSPLTAGYAYGFGLVSDGTTFTPPHSYAFTSSYAFIAGNTLGHTNPVGNTVNGLVGPGQITISGKLLTAFMTTGLHTLEVLVHTGAGVNPDKLVSILDFTVGAAPSGSNIVTSSVSAGSTSAQVTVSGVGTVNLSFSNPAGVTGNVVIEAATSANVNTQIPGAFTIANEAGSYFTVGTSTARTAGPILIIDVSALNLPPGTIITVTVPYFPSAVPPGSTPTIFRFDGTNWVAATNVSVGTNTITGSFTALSPVVAGYIPTATTTTAGGGGGGGGGGAGIPTTVTFPDSYFIDNPLAKVQVQTANIVNMQGFTVSTAQPGQQVVLTSSFKNFQQKDQSYAIIIQVIDQNGFTADIGWTQGVLASGQTADASRSWIAGDAGTYTIRIFVWDGVSAAPTPLSETTSRTFNVT